MKQWNGLMKKEWSSMKEWFYGVIGAAVVCILIIPFGISLLYQEVNALGLSFGISIAWTAAGVVIPTVVLLNSLGKEMQRPDVWLHSTASISKLLGVKMIFAALIGGLNLVVSMMMLFIQLKFSTLLLDITFKTAIQMGGLLILALYVASIAIMCTGLFFGAIFQVIKPITKGFTWPIILTFFLVTSWVTERITRTALYNKIGEIGPVLGPKKGAFELEEGKFFFEIEEIYFRTGDLLMDLIIAVILFIIATVLIEKKVRL